MVSEKLKGMENSGENEPSDSSSFVVVSTSHSMFALLQLHLIEQRLKDWSQLGQPVLSVIYWHIVGMVFFQQSQTHCCESLNLNVLFPLSAFSCPIPPHVLLFSHPFSTSMAGPTASLQMVITSQFFYSAFIGLICILLSIAQEKSAHI